MGRLIVVCVTRLCVLGLVVAAALMASGHTEVKSFTGAATVTIAVFCAYIMGRSDELDRSIKSKREILAQLRNL